MGEWRETTLGDVATFQRGFDITKSQQAAGSVPVISSGGIKSFHNQAMSPGPGVVIGRKGSLGTVFYSSEPYWPHDKTLWVKDFHGNNPRFVFYFMKNLEVTYLDNGTSNPTLNRNHLHPIPVKWPDLYTQETVVALLGALDDKVESNFRVVRATDRLGDAEALKFMRSSSLIELGEQAMVTMGQSPEGCTLNEHGKGMVFYQGIRDFRIRFPKIRVFTTDPKRTANAEDTLLSVRAPVGSVNRAMTDCCIGRGLAAVHSKCDRNALLFYVLKNSRTAWEPFESGGTVFGSINGPQLRGLLIPDTRVVKAEFFQRELEILEAQIKSLVIESIYLVDLRDALLPRLMDGTLTVRAAEDLVSDAV